MIELTSFEFWALLFLTTHISVTANSLFLHRFLAHGFVDFHHSVSSFFEAWLWLMVGTMDPCVRKVHIFHHKTSDTPSDPHSPHIDGKMKWLVNITAIKFFDRMERVLTNPFWFQQNYKDFKDVSFFKYAHMYPNLGMLIFLVVSVALFGVVDGILFFMLNDLAVWIHQITFGYGLSHLIGYRNYDSNDKSRNVFPIGFIFGGEELHNNHHTSWKSVNFADKWFEFDIGYWYIVILNKLGLCKILTK